MGVNSSSKLTDKPLWPIYLENAVAILAHKFEITAGNIDAGSQPNNAIFMLTGANAKCLQIKVGDSKENIEKNIQKIQKWIQQGRCINIGNIFPGHNIILLDLIYEKNTGEITFKYFDQQGNFDKDFKSPSSYVTNISRISDKTAVDESGHSLEDLCVFATARI